jgi:hypothetical protein
LYFDRLFRPVPQGLHARIYIHTERDRQTDKDRQTDR